MPVQALMLFRSCTLVMTLPSLVSIPEGGVIPSGVSV